MPDPTATGRPLGRARVPSVSLSFQWFSVPTAAYFDLSFAFLFVLRFIPIPIRNTRRVTFQLIIDHGRDIRPAGGQSLTCQLEKAEAAKRGVES